MMRAAIITFWPSESPFVLMFSFLRRYSYTEVWIFCVFLCHLHLTGLEPASFENIKKPSRKAPAGEISLRGWNECNQFTKRI